MYLNTSPQPEISLIDGLAGMRYRQLGINGTLAKSHVASSGSVVVPEIVQPQQPAISLLNIESAENLMTTTLVRL